jgi:hypothetical protein
MSGASLTGMLERTLALLAIVTACATDAEPTVPPSATGLEQVWGETIRPGDAIVAVPGTGGYSTLGIYIEAEVDPTRPTDVFDGRAHAGSVEVLDGAIASARRAGITDEALAAGAVDLAIWGAGITKLTAFRYRSLDGLEVTFDVVGGTSVCANGGVFENLPNYNQGAADRDADDLHRRVGQWLARTGRTGRNVILVSHSWGAVVAEYLAASFATYQSANGAWTGASLAFAVAGGVPALVPGFQTLGPGLRTISSTAFDGTAEVRTYEVTRPDDPIRTLNPHGNGGGHHYIIMVGDEYLGWYGITTDKLACAGVPGICPERM